eukprot:TRINITY_DN5858_c1_g1_i1.p1 TRINITY_DN5858_c1_g1~~TRINITY_DN5858_c1_g1_i1.p1  ORF type:complete len:151 (-),score=53.51 TRINITY_DN5858_c1_g1_i1:106-558(-)
MLCLTKQIIKKSNKTSKLFIISNQRFYSQKFEKNNNNNNNNIHNNDNNHNLNNNNNINLTKQKLHPFNKLAFIDMYNHLQNNQMQVGQMPIEVNKLAFRARQLKTEGKLCSSWTDIKLEQLINSVWDPKTGQIFDDQLLKLRQLVFNSLN